MCYGSTQAEQVHTSVRFETKSLFVGNTTTMYCQLRLLNQQELPVSNFRPEFASQCIQIEFNGKQLPHLLATSKIG